MTNPDFDELERTLAAARSRLDALRARAAGGLARRAGRQDGLPGDPGTAAVARGSGEAAAGQVRAVAVSDHATGLIESVQLEPRVLRMATGELAGHLVAALNAAVDDLRANALAAPGAGAVPGIDVGVLAKRLSEVQDQAARELYQLTSALQDVVAKISRDANMPGAVAVPDVDELFEQTRLTLASLGAASAGTARAGSGPAGTARAGAGPAGTASAGTPPAGTGPAGTASAGADGTDAGQDGAALRGEGEAGAGGFVRAVAGPGGHVESLSIEPAAVRKGSHELAGYVVTAVNAALEDLYLKQRTRIEPALADRAELAERIRTVQDLSVRQMRAFGESLAELMASIAPRE